MTNAGNYIADGESYSEHLRRLEEAANKDRTLCDIGNHMALRVHCERIELTGETICDTCREAWTLQQLIAYVKHAEPRPDPAHVIQVINQLYPHHQQSTVSKFLKSSAK